MNQQQVGRANTIRNSSLISPPASLTQSMLNSRRAISLDRMTQDCFQLSVQLSPKASVRDVVDIIANPDMLRFWCEPITALVVTDHKGGSISSTASSSLKNNSKNDSQDDDEQYVYPDIDDCDDDIIVPPAEDRSMKIKCQALQQREEYHDGEWIKASTPEIILPHLHTTFLDSCFKNISTILGFPEYGSVQMFIERNSAQVGFELGPFRAGTMLSHKIVVSQEAQGVVLTDEVTILTKDEEDDDWLVCSCFVPMLDLTRQWSKASLDGYIDQTKASLRNLIDLVEGGGELAAYNTRRSRVYGEEISSFSGVGNNTSQMIPLLS